MNAEVALPKLILVVVALFAVTAMASDADHINDLLPYPARPTWRKSMLTINGVACKAAKEITVKDFWFSGFEIAAIVTLEALPQPRALLVSTSPDWTPWGFIGSHRLRQGCSCGCAHSTPGPPRSCACWKRSTWDSWILVQVNCSLPPSRPATCSSSPRFGSPKPKCPAHCNIIVRKAARHYDWGFGQDLRHTDAEAEIIKKIFQPPGDH